MFLNKPQFQNIIFWAISLVISPVFSTQAISMEERVCDQLPVSFHQMSQQPGGYREYERRQQPARSEREFQSQRYRFAFNVPTNYRVVAHRNDMFFVMPEDNFIYYRCQIQNNEFGTGGCYTECDRPQNIPLLSQIVIKIREIPSSSRNDRLEVIVDQLRQSFPTFMTVNPQFTSIGRNHEIHAYVYSWLPPASEGSIPVLNLLSSNRQYWIQISNRSQADDSPEWGREVTNRILATLRLF